MRLVGVREPPGGEPSRGLRPPRLGIIGISLVVRGVVPEGVS
jgi:hypothetical protein